MDEESTALLRDLVWLNAVIATELVQITENTSAILRGASPPETCLEEHRAIREHALAIAERCRTEPLFARHLREHQ